MRKKKQLEVKIIGFPFVSFRHDLVHKSHEEEILNLDRENEIGWREKSGLRHTWGNIMAMKLYSILAFFLIFRVLGVSTCKNPGWRFCASIIMTNRGGLRNDNNNNIIKVNFFSLSLLLIPEGDKKILLSPP